MHPNQWKSLLLRPRGVIRGFSKSLVVPCALVDHLLPRGGDTHRATARIGPPATCHEDALVHKMSGISEVCPASVALPWHLLTGDVALDPIAAATPRSSE